MLEKVIGYLELHSRLINEMARVEEKGEGCGWWREYNILKVDLLPTLVSSPACALPSPFP